MDFQTLVDGARQVALTAIVATTLAGSAHANVQKFSFEDGPWTTGSSIPDSDITNFTNNHFSFSPGCHWDFASPVNPTDFAAHGHFIGWDTSGCDKWSNPDYLGPGGPAIKQPKLFLQQEFGEAFTLESLVFASVFDQTGGLTVRSSKGGFFQTDYTDGYLVPHNFSGSEWTDVAWLEFQVGSPGVPVGIDDLVVSGHSIPEPGMLSLAVLAGGAAAASRRRKNR